MIKLSPVARELLWSYVDDVAHFLYEPTGLGRRGYRHRWHHNLHLLPGNVVSFVCYKYDVALGMDYEQARDGMCTYVSPRTKRKCWRVQTHGALCKRHYWDVRY